MTFEQKLVGMKDIREWDESFREVFFCEFHNKLKVEIQDYGHISQLVAMPCEQFYYTIQLNSKNEEVENYFCWHPDGIAYVNCDENEAEWVGSIIRDHYDKYPSLKKVIQHQGPAPADDKPRGSIKIGDWVFSWILPFPGSRLEKGVLYHPAKLMGKTWYSVCFVEGELRSSTPVSACLKKERPELLAQLESVMLMREDRIAEGIEEREYAERPKQTGKTPAPASTPEVSGSGNPPEIRQREPKIKEPKPPKPPAPRKIRIFKGNQPDMSEFTEVKQIGYVDENNGGEHTTWSLYVKRNPTNNWNDVKLIATGEGAAHKGSYFLCYSIKQDRLSTTPAAEMLAAHRPTLEGIVMQSLRELLQ